MLSGLSATVLVLRPSPARWRGVVASGLILLTVFLLAGWRANASYLPAKDNFFATQFIEGDLLAGTVRAVRPATNRMRAEVELTYLLRDSTAEIPVVGKLLVYLPPDEKTATLEIGDDIVLEGTPRELSAPLNPYVFNLKAYWSRQGIYHQVFLREGAGWRRVARSGGSIMARAERWRRAWFRSFQRYLSGDQLAVASALVMGKRDLISEEVKSAYTDTGAMHVLAVSGLHVGIIFLLLNFLLVKLLRLNRTPPGRWAVAIISVLCIWLFALVSGLSTSVMRAAVMFSILAAGNLVFRKTDVFNVLAAAAIIILWFFPEQLFQVGFQLSFTAIIGIVLFTRYLEGLWEMPTKIIRSAWSAMSASTGAQLGTLPLSLYHFGQFPTWFLLSGTVVILSAFAIMFAGLLHGAVAGLFGDSTLAEATGILLGGLVGIQNGLVFFFQGLPGGLLKVPVFPWYLSLLLAISIGLLAAWFRWRKAWSGILGLVLFGLTIIWARTLVRGEVEEAGVIVYHVSRASLIDVPLNNGTSIAFGESPTARNLAWTAGPYRERRDYEPPATLPFTAADTVLSPETSWEAPYLNTPTDRFLILDRDNFRPNPDFTGVTKILVINRYKPEDFPPLPAGFKPLVIIDGSTPYYRYPEWRKLAAERGFDIWITGEDGAWEE